MSASAKARIAEAHCGTTQSSSNAKRQYKYPCLLEKPRSLWFLATWKSCDACPPAAILGHENMETLFSVGARIPRIRLAGRPLCPHLCLGLLPATSLIGM